MEKLPNWLRYILAIPFGFICLIIMYYICYFSNLWIASPDSLMIKFFNYIYNNGINAIVFIYAMDTMLPKHQFKFAVTISIIFCGIGMIGLGMSIMTGDITVSYLISLVFNIICFIYACYYTFKEYNEVPVIITPNNQNISNTYNVTNGDNSVSDEQIEEDKTF